MVNFEFGKLDPPVHNDNLAYHYCSLDSFFNIVKTKKIRLYDLTLMNDPSEVFFRKVDFFQKLLKDYELDPFEFKIDYNGHSIGLKDYLAPSQFDYSLTAGGNNNVLLLALCLSKDEDNLVQWRLYADEGFGVCLGFKEKSLNDYRTLHENFSFEKIEYVDNILLEIERKANIILNKIKNLYQNDKTELMNYRFNLMSEFYDDVYKYKVNSYNFEKEVRLIYCNRSENIIPNSKLSELSKLTKDIKFDTKKNIIRPYIEIDLEDLGLRTITLGPQNKNSKSAINLFLSKYLPNSEVEIYKSYIPYIS